MHFASSRPDLPGDALLRQHKREMYIRRRKVKWEPTKIYGVPLASAEGMTSCPLIGTYFFIQGSIEVVANGRDYNL